MDDFKFVEIFKFVDDDLKSSIKSYYVFKTYSELNVLFITKNNEVFGFGENKYGVCGQGDDQSIEKPHPLRDLKNKNVKEFFNGF